MTDSEGRIYFTDFIFDFKDQFVLSEDGARVSAEELRELRGRLIHVLWGGYESDTLEQLNSIIGLVVEIEDGDEAHIRLNDILANVKEGEMIISFDPYENKPGQPINFVQRSIVRRLTTGEKIFLENERRQRNEKYDNTIQAILAGVGEEWIIGPEEPKGNN